MFLDLYQKPASTQEENQIKMLENILIENIGLTMALKPLPLG